jgi:hypothetical protein
VELSLLRDQELLAPVSFLQHNLSKLYEVWLLYMQYILSPSYNLIIICTILVGKPTEPTEYPSKMKKTDFLWCKDPCTITPNIFCSYPHTRVCRKCLGKSCKVPCTMGEKIGKNMHNPCTIVRKTKTLDNRARIVARPPTHTAAHREREERRDCGQNNCLYQTTCTY